MAYGTIYSIEFDDVDGTNYIANLQKENYVGSSTELTGGGSPLTISWRGGDEIFDVMKTSEAILRVMDETGFFYEEFFGADSLDYKLQIFRGNPSTLYWEGVYQSDTYNEPYVDTPYPVELRFSDGLGELQFVRFENSPASLKTGFDSLIDILQFCLNKLPVTNNLIEVINIFEDSMASASSDGMLTQTYIDQERFREFDEDGRERGLMCYTVIEEILKSHFCRLFKSEDKWYVQRIEELGELTPNFVEYNDSGAIIDSGTITLRKTIDNLESGIVCENQDGELNIGSLFSRLVHNYKHRYVARLTEQLIKNPEFLTRLRWIRADGSPRYWDSDANLQVFWDADDAQIVQLSAALQSVMMSQLVYMNELNLPGSGLEPNASGMLFNTAVMDKAAITDMVMHATSDDAGLFSTQANFVMTTNDTLFFEIALIIFKYVDDPTLRVALSRNHKVTVELEIRIAQSGPFKYLSGTPDSNTWETDPTSRITIDLIASETFGEFVETNSTITPNFKFISFNTAKFPESFSGNLNIFLHIPAQSTQYYYNIGINSYDRFTYTDSLYIERISCTYQPGGNTNLEEESKVSIVDDERLKEHTFEIDTWFSDGPNTVSQGAIRLSDDSLTSNWDKDGETNNKVHKDIFIIDPAKKLLSNYRKKFAGSLYTQGGFEMWNVLLNQDFSSDVVYMIDAMDIDVKNITRSASLIELINSVRTWVEEEDTHNPPKLKLETWKYRHVTERGIIDEEKQKGPRLDTKRFRPKDSNDVTNDDTKHDRVKLADAPTYSPSKVQGVYNFNNDDTNKVPDFSQNGNHSEKITDLTVVGGETVGKAGRFNGTSTEVGMGNVTATDGATKLSVQAKVNKTSDKDQTIISKPDNYRLRMTAAGKGEFAVKISAVWKTVETAGAIATGSYKKVMGIYDGAAVKIYVDGALDSSAAATGTLDASTKLVTMGADGASGEYFDGDIEGAEVWTDDRSAEASAMATDSMGVPLQFQAAHDFQEGDLIAYEFQDAAQTSRMVVTLNESSTKILAKPVSDVRPTVYETYTHYGNVFDVNRQQAAEFHVDSMVPKIVFRGGVSAFGLYETSDCVVMKADGIFIKNQAGGARVRAIDIFGNGTQKEFTLNHQGNTDDIVAVQLIDQLDKSEGGATPWERVDSDNIKLKFNVAPPSGRHYRAVLGFTSDTGLMTVDSLGKSVNTISGDGSTKTFNIAHGMDTEQINKVFMIRTDKTPKTWGEVVDFTIIDSDNIQLIFNAAPRSSRAYDIVILARTSSGGCCGDSVKLKTFVEGALATKEVTLKHNFDTERISSVQAIRTDGTIRDGGAVSGQIVDADSIKIIFARKPRSSEKYNFVITG